MNIRENEKEAKVGDMSVHEMLCECADACVCLGQGYMFTTVHTCQHSAALCLREYACVHLLYVCVCGHEGEERPVGSDMLYAAVETDMIFLLPCSCFCSSTNMTLEEHELN